MVEDRYEIDRTAVVSCLCQIVCASRALARHRWQRSLTTIDI